MPEVARRVNERQPAGAAQRGRISLPVLFLVPLLMFGFGYLMVPIYDVLCDITGLNGKTGAISESQAAQLAVDENREIKVEFTSSLNQYAPWQFRPKVASMVVRPGKQYATSYVATNIVDQRLTAQAVPSVAPGRAASYFNKTECFCFVQQTFEANETRDMPLVFVVDPGLPADVDTITLSYTFFDMSKQQVN